jgi:hypothetical protein
MIQGSGIYTALAMEITLVYFKGEVSPYGWAKVPAYPLCGGSTNIPTD